MNKRLNPTLIGAFVFGAITLLVVSIIIFGSGRLFQKTYEFILYFDSSVEGLNAGAPVKIRGVEIGTVKNILLSVDPSEEGFNVPVIVELNPSQITDKGLSAAALGDPMAFESAIDRGLRGRLELQSVLTGLLAISLDVYPDSPVVLRQELGGEYQEIPTLPTPLEEVGTAITKVIAQLKEVDFKKLIDLTTETIHGLNQLVNAPETQGLTRSLDATNKGLQELITLTSEQFDLLSSRVDTTIQRTDAALTKTSDVLTEIKFMVEEDSPLRHDVSRALNEITSAARSVRDLADYLDRNPNALLYGK